MVGLSGPLAADSVVLGKLVAEELKLFSNIATNKEDDDIAHLEMPPATTSHSVVGALQLVLGDPPLSVKLAELDVVQKPS